MITTLAGLLPSPPEGGGGAAPEMGAVGIIIPIITLAIVVFCLVNWMRMLIHVIRHRDIEGRLMWLLLVLLLPLIGWVTYLFMVKRPYDAGDDNVRV